jgi:hypothetical protein
VIEAKADPQHVAAHVGDAIALAQHVVPARRIGVAEGEEAGVRAVVERVEQLGRA